MAFCRSLDISSRFPFVDFLIFDKNSLINPKKSSIVVQVAASACISVCYNWRQRQLGLLDHRASILSLSVVVTAITISRSIYLEEFQLKLKNSKLRALKWLNSWVVHDPVALADPIWCSRLTFPIQVSYRTDLPLFILLFLKRPAFFTLALSNFREKLPRSTPPSTTWTFGKSWTTGRFRQCV